METKSNTSKTKRTFRTTFKRTFYHLILLVYLCYLKVKPYLNLKMIVSFGLAWMLTNGIWYIFAFWGSGWARGIGVTMLAFLWFPTTPEKLITIPIALFFQKILFIPSDKKVYKKYKQRSKKMAHKLENLYDDFDYIKYYKGKQIAF